MRLIHHNKEVVKFDPNLVYQKSDRDPYFKPTGLWVSDEDDYGWSHWCAAEAFRPEDLKYEHLVELTWDNNILFITNSDQLDTFHNSFKAYIGDWEHEARWCNWEAVYSKWQGIIITPYLWERRMDYMWYYGWDCASGCIWDLKAIRTFTPLLKQLKGKTE